MAFNDVIIIGSGIAALAVADKLAMDKNVIIFTKSRETASNSFHAQGGIAAAVDPDDHWSDHFHDTIVAGCQHSDLDNLQPLIQNGFRHLFDLVQKGLMFDQNSDGEWNLGKEGGHLKRRILHAGGDATGKALMTFMLRQVNNKVTIIKDEMVINLLVQDQECVGVTSINAEGDGFTHLAGTTILATGGCGQLFSYTSNDPTVTGDGIAMAYRAGVKVTDMEFVQFHPTLLYNGKKVLGLVSEAVRGEGAFLVNGDGRLIMEGVHELKDLAPRDVVARTIFNEMNKGEPIFLNIEDVWDFPNRFPTIYKLCMDNGIDIKGNILPIIPGAHFMIGGIKANRFGQTSMNGLYAVGEVACTGVHGANRIASNSLLEGIVFGNMTGEAILARENKVVRYEPCRFKESTAKINLPTKGAIQLRMMHDVGVVRNEQGLLATKDWLEGFDFLHADLLSLSVREAEIVNMLTTAWLITTSALRRRKSRGAHYRSDFPMSNALETREEIIRTLSESEETIR